MAHMQDHMAMLQDCIATELEAGQVQVQNFETMLPLSNDNAWTVYIPVSCFG